MLYNARMEKPKALIAVAGYGTRRFPVAATVEKCMLPVGNLPIVHYAVGQCVEAGITDITFVVDEQSDQLRQFYSEPDTQLAAYLEKHHKGSKLRELQEIARMATFSYLVQERDGPYGTAVPLWIGREALQGSQVLYLFGDQFLHNRDGSNEVARFLQAANEAGTPAAMLALPVSREEAHKYGIVRTEERDGRKLYAGIIEKPSLDQTPDYPLNNGSYWLVGPEFAPYLDRHMRGEVPMSAAHNELLVTDTANAFAADGYEMLTYVSDAEYLDGGTREGHAHTIMTIGRFEGWLD
jgi:UTP--glucose-1-phosphate uridylyltransferase